MTEILSDILGLWRIIDMEGSDPNDGDPKRKERRKILTTATTPSWLMAEPSTSRKG